MSTLKVNTVLSADTPTVNITDGLNVTGVSTVATLNTTNLVNSTQLSNRNIIINGAMRIAQRGTSSTENGYGDLDRWKHEYAGTDENPTFAQVSLTTSDTPYTLGLTKAFKLTNGNQTSGLQASSLINFNQQIEAQNIRNSGWNYTSSSSYITLSFWVRASVEQNYHGFLKTVDGTNYIYPYETGTLSANTWTKITKSIPGNSNLTIDDNNASGFQVFPIFFGGTNYTSSSVTNDAWANWSGGSGRSKDQTATWYNTNDATLEITGVQLEVGSVATPFEHRSIADELARCQRYYYVHAEGDNKVVGQATVYQNNDIFLIIYPTVTMRTTPTVEQETGTNYYRMYHNGGYDSFDSWGSTWNIQPNVLSLNANASQGVSVSGGGDSTMIITSQSGAKISFSAEI